MRVSYRLSITGILLLSAIVCFAVQEKQKECLVQVKTGQLRDAPSFLAKLLSPLSYGEKVTVIDRKGEWMKITSLKGTTGWVHGSALTARKIKMTAGSQDAKVAASGDEMALAGKGFNKDVEADYKTKNKNIDYTWVDAMDSMVVTPPEIQKFVSKGDLHPLQ